jgi:hypothetical protein
VVALGLAILFPIAAMHPAPVAAGGGSCTGWQSTRIPPDTIRVFRNATGVVEVVPFQTYVVTVMGKEWPGYLPVPLIEAGSVAVKQYAWYYTMVGRHRSSYVNEAGECYDVRDTTGDQLYKPEKARIVNKHYAALDVTWDYSLRKDGRHFLTGYRTGEKGPCGYDATGWKLFARSAVRCAEELGYNWRQILHTYYGPDLHVVHRDGTIVDDQGGPIGDAGIMGSALVPGSGPKTYDERNDAIQWRGDWQKTQNNSAWKGTLTYASDRSAFAEVRVAARSIKLLARTGPERGRLNVFVDGTLKETVDLFSAERNSQQVVFRWTWEEDRVRTLRLELDGPADRPRVDIDGIVLER